jgi:hypothetical protein
MPEAAFEESVFPGGHIVASEATERLQAHQLGCSCPRAIRRWPRWRRLASGNAGPPEESRSAFRKD